MNSNKDKYNDNAMLTTKLDTVILKLIWLLMILFNNSELEMVCIIQSVKCW